MTASDAVERIARAAYGRLLASLARRTGDLDSAEDALGDALLAALRVWPRDGIPDRPEAWLATTARRRLIDGGRRRSLEARVMAEAARTSPPEALPDDRLHMMLVCSHPAVAESVRTPLMLQTVLGFDAASIASAFLVSPAAMGQRLARAKAKIRMAGISFDMPDAAHLPERIAAVLEAIYAAYGFGWEDEGRRDLTAEAIEIGRTAVALLPDEPEALGLLALMLYGESRRNARRDDEGRYVPLSQQDVGRWSLPLIEEAERLLTEASRHGRHGRFQFEAAIQSVHAMRLWTHRTEWSAIVILYEGLLGVAPTLAARLGYIAAIAEERGSEEAWSLLENVPKDRVLSYQPYWALAANLLHRLGRTQEAALARERAVGLCTDAAVRAYLLASPATSRHLPDE